MRCKTISAVAALVVLGALASCTSDSRKTLTPAEARAIAKDAYVYGFPMVDSYRIQHAYFIERQNPEFKAPWNELRNIPRVFTPEDKAVQTPNSDTPYSIAGLDLRAEPMVLTVPAIQKERYFSVQLIDLYTHNFDYIGSRATGNGGGSFLIAGPRWRGGGGGGGGGGGLNFVLTQCPTVPSETTLMERFATIGVGAGKTTDVSTLAPDIKQALEQGMADAWKEYEDFKTTQIDTGKVTSGDLFGTRDFLKNNYLYRMTAAILGIYGNSKAEAMYPLYTVDDTRQKLDASTGRYTLRFAPGELPPVNAFWSVTMYKLPESLLVVNPLNRYLLNSAMLPQFARDADGGVTLYIQHESPGKDKEANWLPAPKGPFLIAMRLYWPKEEAMSGKWTAPPLKRAS